MKHSSREANIVAMRGVARKPDLGARIVASNTKEEVHGTEEV